MKVNLHLILSILMIPCIIIFIKRNDVFALMTSIIGLVLNFGYYMKD